MLKKKNVFMPIKRCLFLLFISRCIDWKKENLFLILPIISILIWNLNDKNIIRFKKIRFTLIFKSLILARLFYGIEKFTIKNFRN